MIEAFFLIVLFLGFYEGDQVDQPVAENNNDKKIINVKQHKKTNETNINQFEIINKNGVWVFAPVQTKNITNLKTKNEPLSEFIVLPDGSKIEKGL